MKGRCDADVGACQRLSSDAFNTQVRGAVHEVLGRHYCSVLVNYYPGGGSGMRFHADPGQGEVRGWDDYRADTDAATDLTLAMFPDAGLDLDTQRLQAARQVPLMFSDLTDANGFGWWTDETVAANIETLALLGRTVTPDLWDRSVLEDVYG